MLRRVNREAERKGRRGLINKIDSKMEQDKGAEGNITMTSVRKAYGIRELWRYSVKKRLGETRGGKKAKGGSQKRAERRAKSEKEATDQDKGPCTHMQDDRDSPAR